MTMRMCSWARSRGAAQADLRVPGAQGVQLGEVAGVVGGARLGASSVPVRRAAARPLAAVWTTNLSSGTSLRRTWPAPASAPKPTWRGPTIPPLPPRKIRGAAQQHAARHVADQRGRGLVAAAPHGVKLKWM
jgi:hypothetical protein